MKLVLDTNIFCQDYRLRSTNFRLLREGLHVIPAQLYVPEVVLDELENRYREDISDALDRARKTRDELARLDASLGTEVPTVDPAEAARQYRSWLVDELAAVGTVVLPYPEVPHKIVVQRDLGRRRPFKRNGSGYRDFLIWNSIRPLSFQGEPLVFITANTADFADGDRLADDLAGDLLNPHRVQLIASLHQFNEEHVRQRLEMVNTLRERLAAEAGATFDVSEWILGGLIDELATHDLGTVCLGFPEDVGRTWATKLLTLESFSVEDVRRLANEQVLVDVEVKLEVELMVDIDWSDYVNHEEVREWTPGDQPFEYETTWLPAQLALGFNLTLDPSGKELIDKEISWLAGDADRLEIDSW